MKIKTTQLIIIEQLRVSQFKLQRLRQQKRFFREKK